MTKTMMLFKDGDEDILDDDKLLLSPLELNNAYERLNNILFTLHAYPRLLRSNIECNWMIEDIVWYFGE